MEEEQFENMNIIIEDDSILINETQLEKQQRWHNLVLFFSKIFIYQKKTVLLHQN